MSPLLLLHKKYSLIHLTFYLRLHRFILYFDLQGEWKPKKIDNPDYKGKWIHPEIDNPEYEADENLYRFADFGVIGFDLWQVCSKAFTPLH